MKIFLFFLFSFSILRLSYCNQEINIPNKILGVSIGQLNSTFKLDAYLDLLCPGSKESFNTIMRVINDEKLIEKNFLFMIHLFPLPYHTFSFKMSIVAKYIQQKYGNDKALEYISKIFENQDDFSNEILVNTTLQNSKEKLADFVENYTSKLIKKEEILEIIEKQEFDIDSRIEWKIGCQMRVAGTPSYFANDIKIDDVWTFDYQQWVDFFLKYLSGIDIEDKKGLLKYKKNIK